MRELIFQEDAGQRLDKYLQKYLNLAPKSFLYKMLRKKNIVLNGKKAEGSEKLKNGDVIRLYLSEETLEKFHQEQASKTMSSDEWLAYCNKVLLYAGTIPLLSWGLEYHFVNSTFMQAVQAMDTIDYSDLTLL